MLAVAELDPGLLAKTIDDGTAFELFGKVVEAQGGDRRVVEDPEDVLPRAPHQAEVAAEAAGYLTTLDAYKVGVAAMRLGAGRERKEDTIDPAVGITLHAKPGAEVAKDQPLLTLHYRHPARLEEALRVLDGAIAIGENQLELPPLIIERIDEP